MASSMTKFALKLARLSLHIASEPAGVCPQVFAFQEADALDAIAHWSKLAAGFAVAPSAKIEPETVEAGICQLACAVHVHAMVSEQMIGFAGDE